MHFPKHLNLDTDFTSKVLNILTQAGRIALRYHQDQSFEITYKDDQSPVTNADIQVSEFIVEQLKILTPDFFVVSEENETNDFTGDTFWLLDPIDGTKYYIQGQSGYTINLALIHNHLPIIGYMYHPSLGEIYYNDLDGKVKFYDVLRNLHTQCSQQDSNDALKVLIDFGQLNLAKIEQEASFTKIYPQNTRSKISMLLNNQVDVYYLYRNLMEWDTAAAHAILRAIGGSVMDMLGNELVYGKPLFYNPSIIFCSPRAMPHKQKILSNLA